MTVLFRPPPAVRAAALAAVVLLFVGMRHGIGNAIQRRFFMKVDFDVTVTAAPRCRTPGVSAVNKNGPLPW
jgi:hypothetical protein